MARYRRYHRCPFLHDPSCRKNPPRHRRSWAVRGCVFMTWIRCAFPMLPVQPISFQALGEKKYRLVLRKQCLTWWTCSIQSRWLLRSRKATESYHHRNPQWYTSHGPCLHNIANDEREKVAVVSTRIGVVQCSWNRPAKPCRNRVKIRNRLKSSFSWCAMLVLFVRSYNCYLV